MVHDPRPEPAPKRHGGNEKPILGRNGMKLKQLQYRSYRHDIAIYHFQAYYTSIHNFRSILRRKEHGYVGVLLGVDHPGHYKAIIDGDEIAEGCIEAGYLYNVFQNGGSALGFCMGNNVIEWLCFDRDIKASLLDKIAIETPMSQMLFDYVGSVEKGIVKPRVKGADLEHKGWYESLLKAERPPAMLKLSWATFRTELMREYERKRRDYETPMLGLDGMVELDEYGALDGAGQDRDASRKLRATIYQDPNVVFDDATARKPAFNHSCIPPQDSVLRDRNTNTLRVQLSSKNDKREKGIRILTSDYS
jgi:hypothetical protein